MESFQGSNAELVRAAEEDAKGIDRFVGVPATAICTATSSLSAQYK